MARLEGWGQGEGYRGGCCEKLLEASPMSDSAQDPMPAGSYMDLLLAKADSGSAL